MSEILIKKKYIIPELTPGEIMLLVIIYSKNKLLYRHYLKTYKDYIPIALESLQNKLYLKITGDEFEELILRKNGEDMFTETNNTSFETFWKNYHEITTTLKTDKEPAKKYWNKLKQPERKLAINNIKPYFDSLNDVKFCKKARTYLDNKDFNNEFKLNVNERNSGTSKFSLPGAD